MSNGYRQGALLTGDDCLRRWATEKKLALRTCGGPKRAIGTRAPILVPMTVNDRWWLDSVQDQLADGCGVRILTIVDDCTRKCLGLVADASLSGLRVARELDRINENRGKLDRN